MSALFASGRIVDLILLLMLIEAAFVVAYRRKTGCGIAVTDFFVTLISGVSLMLALRAALVGLSWHWIALALFASLLGHLTDIARRWNR